MNKSRCLTWKTQGNGLSRFTYRQSRDKLPNEMKLS
jgi:hypothetical protein